MKTKYVIDANVLFNAFISGKEVFRLLFSECIIYVPDYAFLEIEKYKTRILSKTKLTEQEFKEFVLTLLQNVIVIPNLLLSPVTLKQAYHLCQSIDEKDTIYVATAIEFGFTLITSDRKLYYGLKERNFTQVVLLEDVIKQLPAMKDPGIELSEN